DVVLEVEYPLEVLQRHIEQQADAGGQRLQKPDVSHGSGELDMAHALAAHLGERHLDAALLADQALVLHALVLAAQALVILDRAEDARAEQAVPLRLERAVVDRLGLLDLAERPRQDGFRAGDRNLDLVESRHSLLLLENVRDLVHSALSSRAWPGALQVNRSIFSPVRISTGEDLGEGRGRVSRRPGAPRLSCAPHRASDGER